MLLTNFFYPRESNVLRRRQRVDGGWRVLRGAALTCWASCTSLKFRCPGKRRNSATRSKILRSKFGRGITGAFEERPFLNPQDASGIRISLPFLGLD